MAAIAKVLFGGGSPASSAAPSDADFADFATAASPLAPSHAASSLSSGAAAAASTTGSPSVYYSNEGRPYTAWYRVWERTSLADFYQELFIIPIILVIVLVNIVGTRANRSRAKKWASTYLPMLDSEFASVGFGGRKSLRVGDVKQDGIAQAVTGSTDVPADLLKEKSKSEYVAYATGRQNVAWLDIRISLYKRNNPLAWFGELATSFFTESFPAPAERVEATAYCFDGKEKTLLPMAPASKDSTYDGFVWAIVHKDKMRTLRDERYDISLTSTKDHPKLPQWATVMSESAEVTEAMLTPDLIKAVTDAGEDLEALIITDQPIDAPKKLDDLVPRKRIYLSMRLNPKPASTSLFATFLRLPDHLVSTAHFRPEALRKVRATREEEARKLRKLDDEEKAEERRVAAEKLKKEERDRRLGKMSAEEQRKFLQKEKEQENRKMTKKRTQRG
ncbi:hypothetical protein WHR41_07526 [Cladosporium halotolerans]|uniref:DUF1682-domain-containing protein n=1 Tax=Cladosporium halotolerans TaxID=1052096 RepID=A0AB34KL17_9PEZI